MTRREKLAIRLMIAQSVLFVGETAVIHHIGPAISTMLLASLRAGAGMALAILLTRHLSLSVLYTRQLSLQLLRGLVTLLYMWVMIYSFGRLPFADATAISFTQGAYIAVFSMLILGEAVIGARWAAAALGIAGAMLIVRPAFAEWDGAYLIALGGAALNGLAFVLNRYLQRADSETTTMFYTNLVPVVGSLPFALTCDWPDASALPWLTAVVLFGPLGMFVGIVAVKHADAAMLGPYTLLRLVFGLFGALIVFHEWPDALSVLGCAVILVSCLLSSGALERARLMPGRAGSRGSTAIQGSRATV